MHILYLYLNFYIVHIKQSTVYEATATRRNCNAKREGKLERAARFCIKNCFYLQSLLDATCSCRLPLPVLKYYKPLWPPRVHVQVFLAICPFLLSGTSLSRFCTT